VSVHMGVHVRTLEAGIEMGVRAECLDLLEVRMITATYPNKTGHQREHEAMIQRAERQ
jgi:hypothetical protein